LLVAGLLHAQAGAAGGVAVVFIVIELFESLIIICCVSFTVVLVNRLSTSQAICQASGGKRNEPNRLILLGNLKHRNALENADSRFGAILAPPGHHWCKVKQWAIASPTRR
jgi:hypothetical protein